MRIFPNMRNSSYVKCRLYPQLDQNDLKEAAKIYHFCEMGTEEIHKIYDRLIKSVNCRAVYRLEDSRREAAAAITLGEEVDALEDEYQKRGLLTEAYLTDCFCRELLRKGNTELDGILLRSHGLYANRYLFPGQNLPLQELKRIFSHFDGDIPIRLLPGFAMLPRQSVAYVIRLSADPAECAGICADCRRQGECGRQKKI